MILQALVIMTLRNMNEDVDDATIARLGPEIKEMLNVGYQDLLVQRLKVEITEVLSPVFGRVTLSREPVSILKVLDDKGNAVSYTLEGRDLVLEADRVQVSYTFVPAPLSEADDQPAFDPSLHYILADFATYRMFLKGSKQRQARGEAFYGSYLTGVSKLAPELPRAIANKYGGRHG